MAQASVQSPEGTPVGMMGQGMNSRPASRGLTPPEIGSGNRSAMGSREKRTFKDKLHSMIQEAEVAELQAYRQSQLHDKKSLAIATLVEGRPQAYVDFFYLTHSNPPNASVASSQHHGTVIQQAPDADGELPQESLGLLRAQLIRAEAASKAGDSQSVYAAHKSLAQHFAGLGRLRKAEYFFKRCLVLAADSHWLAGELEANLALGLVYEELSDTPNALIAHERRLELASKNLMSTEMDSAYRSLTTVYLHKAESQEEAGDIDSSMISYNKCLNAAHKAGEVATAAHADFKLGMLYHGKGLWSEAMHYLTQFKELASVAGDKAAEGVAHTTYAACLQQVGDVDGAVRSLEDYLHAARRHDPSGSAIACCSLGIMYYEQHKLLQAVTHFEKFFEEARGLSDRRILDIARINLGMARGALQLQKFLGVVDQDLPKLIAWKSSRKSFM